MQPFDWHEMWAPTWNPLTVVVRAAIAYLFVQLMFRLVGRKELARYSTFDIAVLFLISTTMRQTIVGDDKSLTNAMVGLATILFVDWSLSYASFKSPLAARIIQGSVPLLVRDGHVDEQALRRHRISRDELMAQMRQHGRDSLSEVARAHLERTGRVSFVFRPA